MIRARIARAALAAVALVALAAFVVVAQTETVTKGVTTTAPTTGNPVVTYQWQMSVDNGATWSAAGVSTGTAATVTIPLLAAVRVRVRGVDALGGAGPWSEVSDPYTATRGNPGACGKPGWLP